MATKIRVTTAELRKRANDLEALNESFKREVQGLRDDENQLSVSYEGEAQRKFHQAFMTDASKFDSFYELIRRFIQQLRTDADTYDRVERENLNIASTRK